MPEPTIETVQKIKDKIAKDPILNKILKATQKRKKLIFLEVLKRKNSEFNFLPEEMIETQLTCAEDGEKTIDLYFLANAAYNLVEPMWEVEENNFLETLSLNNDFFKLNEKEFKKIKEIFQKIQSASWSWYVGSKTQGPLKWIFLMILKWDNERTICRNETRYKQLHKKVKERVLTYCYKENKHLYKKEWPHTNLELREIFYFFEKIFPKETLTNNPLLDRNSPFHLKGKGNQKDNIWEKGFTFWWRGRCFEKSDGFLVVKPHEEKLREMKLNFKDIVSVFWQLFGSEEMRKVQMKYDDFSDRYCERTNLEWSTPNRYASKGYPESIATISNGNYVRRVVEIVREETHEIFPDKDTWEREWCEKASRTMIEQAAISPKSEYYRFRRLINESTIELQNQLTKVVGFESILIIIEEKIDRMLVRTESTSFFDFIFRLDTQGHKIFWSVLSTIIISCLALLYFYWEKIMVWWNKPLSDWMAEKEE
jgi:hypothetical protein